MDTARYLDEQGDSEPMVMDSNVDDLQALIEWAKAYEVKP